MEIALRALMLGDAGISAIVNDRINFGAHPPRDPYPGIVLNTISDLEEIHMNGKGPGRARVQIDCYAAEYAQVKAAGDAVKTLLNAYVGGDFLFIEQVARSRSREGGTNEAERPYRDRQDFIIHWREN